MRFFSRSTFVISFIAPFAVVALSGCSSGGSGPGNGNGAEPPIVSGKGESCETFISKLPANYFHDWIEVPENYLDPVNSPKIRVFYYGQKGDFESHVVFFNGGPGYDSHGNSSLFDQAFVKFNLPTNKVGFVYIDQRGTGCSDSYPHFSVWDDVLRDRFYGSTGIVYDAEAIRQKLFGQAKWKVFGQSYGAFIVHRYVALFPDSVIDAYAHANTITSDPVERMGGRIYSQYDVTKKYLAVYPDDEVRLKAIRASLISQPKLCLTNPWKISYCGTRISELLIGDMGFSNRWPGIHKRIGLTAPQAAESAPLDQSSLQYIVDHYSPPAVTETDDHIFATDAIGSYDRNVLPQDYGGCSAALAWIKTNYNVDGSEILLSECSGAMQFQKLNERWHNVDNYIKRHATPPDDHLTIAAFVTGLKKLGRDHFYLYSGERDMFVPKENFKEELAATQGLLTYHHFPDSGHEGFITEPQVLNDLLKMQTEP